MPIILLRTKRINTNFILTKVSGFSNKEIGVFHLLKNTWPRDIQIKVKVNTKTELFNGHLPTKQNLQNIFDSGQTPW